MGWTCPDCGKTLKHKSSSKAHLARHDSAPSASTSASGYDPEQVSAAFEAALAGGATLGGEISRLRAKITHDQSHDWQQVYDAYVKSTRPSKAHQGTQHGHSAAERQEIAAIIAADRTARKW